MRLFVVSALAVACHLPVVHGTVHNAEDPACVPVEEVPYTGHDEDCDGADLVDVDNDGYPGVGDPDFAGPIDCDDANPYIRPGGADQPYDGVDQNCDCANDFDDDGDHWMISGLPEAFLTFAAENASRCGFAYAYDQDPLEMLAHYESCSGDCDEWNADVHPGAAEQDDDDVDQNCNGYVDY